MVRTIKQGSLTRSIAAQSVAQRLLRKRTTPNNEARESNLVSVKRGCVIPVTSLCLFTMMKTFASPVLVTRKDSISSLEVFGDGVHSG